MWFFLFIVLILSILQIIFPSEMLMFGRRWQLKEGAEPSDTAIFMARLSSVIVIIVIVFAMISSCS